MDTLDDRLVEPKLSRQQTLVRCKMLPLGHSVVL